MTVDVIFYFFRRTRVLPFRFATGRAAVGDALARARRRDDGADARESDAHRREGFV